MSNLPTLKLRAFDATGAVASGAKLYTYGAGTLTPLGTYTTGEFNVGNANPVVADSGGIFPEIYLAPGSQYRFILKTSADVTIWDCDNINAAILEGDLNTQVYETADNPINHGATGDGTVDDSEGVQSAIDAATETRSGVVDLMGRTYRCDSALTIPSGLKLRNGTLNFSNCNANEFMLAQGSSGNAVNLSSNAAEQANSLSVASISGIAAGDLLHLYDGSGATNGELVFVSSAAASTITLSERIHAAYTTANSAQYKEITPLTDIVLEDLTIVGNASASGTGDAIVLDRCYGAKLRNVTIYGQKGRGLAIKMCVGIVVESCTFRKATSSTGIDIRDASIDTIVADCRFHALSIGVNVGLNTSAGITHRTVISRCLMRGISLTGIDARERSRRVTVQNCELDCEFHAIFSYARDLSVLGCDIYNAQYAIWISGETEASLPAASYATPRSLKIKGNSIACRGTAGFSYCIRLWTDGVDYELIDISGNSLYGDGIRVDLDADNASYALRSISVNNNVHDVGGFSSGNFLAFVASSGANTVTIDRLSVCGNTKDGGADFLAMSNSALLTNLSSVVISGNVADGAVYITGSAVTCSRVVVADNSLEVASGSHGIGITGGGGSGDIVVRGNIVSSATTTGILVSGGGAARVVVAGNSISGVTGTNARGIYTTNAGNITITGNSVGNPGGSMDFGIHAHSLSNAASNVSVSGNSIDGVADTANNAGIKITGDGTSSIFFSGVSVSGNTIKVPETAYGVHIDDYANYVSVANNAIQQVAGTAANNQPIYIDSAASGAINRVAITGNVVHTVNTVAIELSGYIEGATITGNVVSVIDGSNAINIAGAAANAINCVAVTGNSIHNGTYGIAATNHARVIHDGNAFYDQATSHQNGLAAGTSGAGGNYVS